MMPHELKEEIVKLASAIGIVNAELIFGVETLEMF